MLELTFCGLCTMHSAQIVAAQIDEHCSWCGSPECCCGSNWTSWNGAAGNVQGSSGRSARRQQSADFTKKLTAFRQHTASPARVRERLPRGTCQSIELLCCDVSVWAAPGCFDPAVLASSGQPWGGVRYSRLPQAAMKCCSVSADASEGCRCTSEGGRHCDNSTQRHHYRVACVP